MNERLLAELDKWIEEADTMRRTTTEQIYFGGQHNAFVRVRDWIRKNQEVQISDTTNVRGLPGGANLLPSVSNHH